MQAADTATDHNAAAAPKRPTPLPLRDDTILGVCQALGEDFGVPANLIRIALAAGLLWNPFAMVGIYLGLGAIVAVSRWLFPKPHAAESRAPAKQPANEERALDLAA